MKSQVWHGIELMWGWEAPAFPYPRYWGVARYAWFLGVVKIDD